MAHLFFDIPVLAMSDEQSNTSTELFYSLAFLLLPLMKLRSLVNDVTFRHKILIELANQSVKVTVHFVNQDFARCPILSP